MSRASRFSAFFLAGAVLLPCLAADDPVIFRSDVSLVRVDAQVLDRDNRAITGLRQEDFVLKENGRLRDIRNFVSEDMPVDVLFLLDVSASMRPHVQRIASAARQALHVLGDKDRVGIMVFDRSTRISLPFRNSRTDVEHEFAEVLRNEKFRGGTDITRGMLDAIEYIGRKGRPEARRAIVILTDDQTEFERDEERVERGLDQADIVMSALIAPDAMGNMSHSSGTGRGGGFPRGGLGGPLGGIVLPGSGGGRGGYPQSRGQGSGTHSAGTSQIAEQSGGDSLRVDDASALETTLSRIRQRYALYFQLPDGVTKGQRRDVEISLTEAALRRYPDAEVRFRHSYNSPASTKGALEETTGSSEPDRQSQPAAGRGSDPLDVPGSNGSTNQQPKRRPAVSGPGTGAGPLIPKQPD